MSKVSMNTTLTGVTLDSRPIDRVPRHFFNSIGVKLNILFVTIVTLVLSVAGAINFFSTKSGLAARIDSDNIQIQARLQVSVSKALWDLQTDSVGGLLHAEMADPDLLGIAVTTQDQFVAGRRQTADGRIQELKDASLPPGNVQEFELFHQADGKINAVGKVAFMRSADRLSRESQPVLWQTLFEIILADLVLIVGLSLGLRFIVVQPINQAQKALNQIAAGDADLTLRLDDQRNDELGAMAVGFNTFTAGLQALIAQVQDSAAELATTARQTSLIAEQIHQALQQEKNESDQVAKAVTELVSKIEVIAGNAQTAVTMAQAADQQAHLGQTVVNQGVGAMNDLRREIGQSTQAVQSLALDAGQIGRVVVVIQEITEQTNLLALNAAIEAARAGENGRGFAVVADEVRKLATRTQVSTQDIQKMVQRLQGSVQQVVVAMENSQNQVESAVVSAEQAGTRMSDVSGAIQRIATINRDISQASQAQSTAVIGIDKSVRALDRLVEDSEQGAAQSLQASQQLAHLAGAMKGLVGRFKV
ncbi:methyl-accepting chemotaxis protein [Gammaproteobacteria bacterium]